jgi:hypothetical protein
VTERPGKKLVEVAQGIDVVEEFVDHLYHAAPVDVKR